MQKLMSEALAALIEGHWAPSYADRFISAIDIILAADPGNRLIMEAQVALTMGIMATPAPDELKVAAYPCFSSSQVSRFGKNMRIETHEDILEIVWSLLTRKARIEKMPWQDAVRDIEDIIRSYRARYPTAGLSFGYIGNLTHLRDDRNWMIFTSLRDQAGRSVSFGGVSTELLPALLDNIEQNFDDWLQQRLKTNEKIAA